MTQKSGGWWGRQIAFAKVQAVLQRDDGYLTVARTACREPLSPTQTAVVKLLAAGRTQKEISADLGCSERAVKFHVDNAAAKVPGDGPPMAKLAYWYRGAAESVLVRREVTPASRVAKV